MRSRAKTGPGPNEFARPASDDAPGTAAFPGRGDFEVHSSEPLKVHSDLAAGLHARYSALVAASFVSKIRLALSGRNIPSDPSRKALEILSTEELLALMRHESHRIEKAVYNNYFATKAADYTAKHRRLGAIYALLEARGVDPEEPTYAWSRQIYDAFLDLEERFVRPLSSPSQPFDPARADEFIAFLRTRRSSRVWAETQPDRAQLVNFAKKVIDAARWAPNSGNRQAWRFLILVDAEEKALLRNVKEAHTVNAPALVFVGMDARLYGALGAEERGVFIDAGAAIEHMVLTAHSAGLGVCWNHFARDLIESRPANQERYQDFCHHFSIPSYIEPIGIVAFGVVEYHPPTPARLDVESLLLRVPPKEG